MTDKHYYLIFDEREALREQNDRLRAQLVAAGKACEEAATQLMAKDAEIDRLRKELAALLDAACVHRYESMAIKDTFSKAIDRAATVLSR